MIFQTLLAKLGFQTSDWTKGTEKAKQDIKGLDSSVRDTLSSIKGQFGKGSLVAQFTKLLAGGGAIAGGVLAAKKIWDLADSWMGTSKAIDEASRAAKDYEDLVKAIAQAQKQAKEWEEVSIGALIKSYRELDTARNPDHKIGNKLADDLDSIDERIKKERNSVQDLDKTIKDSAARQKRAQQELSQIDVGWHADWGPMGDRIKELRKQLGEESKLQIESTNKKMVLARQLADDEVRANQEKLNKKAAADIEYQEQVKTNADKAAKQAVEAAKKTANDTKKIQLQHLQDERDMLRNKIEQQREILEAGNRIAEVHAIRGGKEMAGIVTSVAKDPNTPILQELSKKLTIVDNSIKSLQRPESNDDIPADW